MSDQDDPLSDEGAWIFLSHSHQDFAKVREVRNGLEALGHRPLMFFLKCLDDTSPELPDLIRREIEARTWFLLCDSPNARASPWVQSELEMISSLPGKVSETVDLDEPLEAQLAKVRALSKRATVLISHAREDRLMAEAIAERLRTHDLTVRSPSDLQAGMDWASTLQDWLDEAMDHGYVLVLVSEASSRSHHVEAATEEVLARGRPGRVLPVRIDQVSRPDPTLDPLARIQWFDLFQHESLDEGTAALAATLKALSADD